MKNALTFRVKKKWFYMILNGVKKEEYREIKPYWTKRLHKTKNANYIIFINGYNKNSPLAIYEFLGYSIKKPVSKWIDDQLLNTDFYALKIGTLITSSNIKNA